MTVVEGMLGGGGGAIIFYLLFWVLNEGGGVRKKYIKHFLGGFQKLKGKKSKIIIAPPLDKL